MAGNISALCLMGAENVVSERSSSPSAMATEPIRLEVSTANISGFSVIRGVFEGVFDRFFQ